MNLFLEMDLNFNLMNIDNVTLYMFFHFLFVHKQKLLNEILKLIYLYNLKLAIIHKYFIECFIG